MPALIDLCDKSLTTLFVSSGPNKPDDVGLKHMQNPRSCFDLNQILVNCIQPALAQIEDPPDDFERRINRLKILLNFLQHSNLDSGTL